MDKDKTRKFYEAKIRREFDSLDYLLDINASRKTIEDREMSIWAWEEAYKSIYGRYFMVDQKQRMVRR